MSDIDVQGLAANEITNGLSGIWQGRAGVLYYAIAAPHAQYRWDGSALVAAGSEGGSGDALTTAPLSQFAATTSAQLRSVLSDETGTGPAVFATSPSLDTPALGTPSAVVLTNATGLPTAGIVDAAVTLAKLANLAQDQFIGRTTASTGVPETATITAAARTVLDDTTTGAMLTTLGAAPRALDVQAAKTAGHTLAATDARNVIPYNSGSAANFVLNNGLGAGFSVVIAQTGAGAVTITGTATATGTLSTTADNDILTITPIGTDTYICKVG